MIHPEATALEPLEWDEQEAATNPALSPAGSAHVRRSSKGWLVITNEWAAEQETCRTTIVSEGPTTERSMRPVASEPPKSGPPTVRRLRPPPPAEEVIELSDFDVEFESAPPQSIAPPVSTVRAHSEIRPMSVPIPLMRDPIGERETRQRLSSINFEAFTEPLEAQITQLRRWLMVSLMLSAVATITAAVAVLFALGGPDVAFPTFELPRMGGASATMANNPRVVGTRIYGHAKTETKAQPKKPVVAAAPSPEPEALAPTDGKVTVTVALLGPHASITLTQVGARQRMVFGPFPTALRLDPGRYTLTAYRPGKRIFQRQLDLELTRPNREVAISFD